MRENRKRAARGQGGQFLEGVSLGQTRNAYRELLAGSQLLKRTKALKT